MSQSHLHSLCSDCSNSMEFNIGDTHSDLPFAESWFQSDTSTGYLEDVIAGKVIQCKDQKVDQFPTCSTTLQSLHGQRKKIAYPFELVKRGGVEGETTLKDINNQILTTPSASKPIPHPVQDSVTHPSFRFSGKAVASFTRIHTRGRGSITIIKTKD